MPGCNVAVPYCPLLVVRGKCDPSLLEEAVCLSFICIEDRSCGQGSDRGAWMIPWSFPCQFTCFCILSSKTPENPEGTLYAYFFLSAQLCLPLISVLPASLVPETSESPFLFYDVQMCPN